MDLEVASIGEIFFSKHKWIWKLLVGVRFFFFKARMNLEVASGCEIFFKAQTCLKVASMFNQYYVLVKT
jgi:hypothetical protein